ncbi:MAG: AMP-binding protein [Alcaligenaceae bacterium]|nr:AMP-binding protein [Alcaligenaceae bacterium]
MNIVQLLLTRARQYPHAPAITFSGATTTFEALADTVTRMAGALQAQLGLRPGDRVALWMENRPEFLESLFACWVAGVCVVPVNAKLHGREVAHIIQNSGAKVVLTTAYLEGALRDQMGADEAAVTVIVADHQEYRSLALGEPIVCHDAAPTDPAWIFYTSGTTGFPKGAILSHRNLIFMSLAYYADIEQVAPGQTMVHAAPLSHGSGQYLLPHLFAGGHQVILPKFDVRQVLEAFTQYEGVSIFAVPTMITRLVQCVEQMPDWKGDVRTIIYGGAPMYFVDLVKAMEVFGTGFYQLYGQGESPMTITGLTRREHALAREAGDAVHLASCGVARTGVEVRVVDPETGHELGPGQLGEIVARSDCVMAGYWNNPAATASALRDGWLWTGDIGVMDEQGYLALRDRSKDMIISGGTNIYPREIEEVLLIHDAVSECAVVGRPHGDLGEEPVAFIVCHEGKDVSATELDELCLQHIARFKRPRDYRYIESLPKSNYGKILKSQLRTLLKGEAS